MRRRRSPPARLPLLVLGVVALLALGAWVAGRHSDWLPGPVRDALVGDGDTRVVAEAIDEVHDTYFRAIPKDKLADDAIEGVVRNLDDEFSAYFDPAEYRRFKATQNSEFSGVGIEIAPHPKGVRVVVVFDGSPAYRAGMKLGDVILRAGGRSLDGISSREAVERIKGAPGSEVELTWSRDGQRTTKTLTRSTVTVPVVASDMQEAGSCRAGVVRLAQFSSGAHGEVYGALKELDKRGAKAFVLDLRANGGGLVNEAQLVASAFLSGGPIVTTRGRSVKESTLTATGEPVVEDAPLVVLVDRDTASASEIVAGALQDRRRATIVGQRTFGKGVFQEVLELSNGGALDITAGQYFTPGGRNLGGQGVARGAGIQPDVTAADDRKTKGDEGLRAALGVLGGKCR